MRCCRYDRDETIVCVRDRFLWHVAGQRGFSSTEITRSSPYSCLLASQKSSMSVAQRRKISDSEELIESGPLKGVTLSRNTEGEVISLSTKSCLDSERWKTMPSLSKWPSMEVLDLYFNRYLEFLDEDSISDLKNLKQLLVRRCSRLQSLPTSIGRLTMLQEVSDKGSTSEKFIIVN